MRKVYSKLRHRLISSCMKCVQRCKVILVLTALGSSSGASAQSPVFYLKYDEANATTTTKEQVSQSNLPITNQFNKPERVAGVTGNALRTDGFSTWISTTKTLALTTSMTVETWIALESYPFDRDTTQYVNIKPSSILNQSDGDAGFSLNMNPFGQWNFTVKINGTKYVCNAPQPFPLYEWTHVVALVDGAGGKIKLYLNGVQIANLSTPVNGTINLSTNPIIIGKSYSDHYDGVFLLNAMNGSYDETKIYTSALTPSTITSNYNSGVSSLTTTGEQAIVVNASRFSADTERPTYHAMPPANWTNEPHGLVEHNGKYHMFYQRTPNGPYKWLMHWGHMVSTDFVRWTNSRDALWPETEWSNSTGYDTKGIWSGDVVSENGVAHAFYTAVNQTGPYNPGIGHATSSDTDLKKWTKTNPVIDKQFVDDFRDPYLFKDGSTWVMLIGSKVSGHGGLDCYTSTDLTTWTHKSNFCTVDYGLMDIGSDVWEMPVFEPIGNGKYILITNPIGPNIPKYGPTKYTRGVYWIGSYVNGQFSPDFNTPKNLDLIPGHLSPTVARNSNNQLTAIGIVDERRNPESQKNAGWCHVFSLPRVYSLLSDNQTLGQAPAPQTIGLRTPGTQQTLNNIAVSSTFPIIVSNGAQTEIMANLNSATTATTYGINIRKSASGTEITRIYYDAVNKKIVLDKSASSTSTEVDNEDKVVITQAYDETAFGKPASFHVFIDNSIVDVFINEKAAFSFRIYPTASDAQGIELYSDGGTTTFTSIDTWSTGISNVAVSSVSLNKTLADLRAGRTETLVATISPSTASNKNITWSSSNTTVASVDATGTVTAKAAGSATVTATTQDGSKTATCTVRVSAQNYTSYNFESGDLTGWTINSGTAFTAANVTQDIAWSWGGPFNQEGLYHFWGFKSTNDTAVGEMKTTSNFSLGGDGIITFRIAGGNKIDSLYIGLCNASGTVLAKATGTDAEGYTVASIDGSAYVGSSYYLKVVDIATGGWGHINLDDIKIPIVTTVPVTGVSLNKTSKALKTGGKDTLIASVAPLFATNKNVTWSSSNTAVATVSPAGVVTAVGVGSATITVTTADGAKTATCTVTVTAQQYLVLDFESGNLNGWTVTSGTAFSNASVCTDTNWGWGGPFTFQGSYHFWGFKVVGDAPVGEMRSSNFNIGGDGQITFLLGGGNNINNLYIALCNASGTELIKQTGLDDEAYSSRTINASAYIGQSCYIKVVDNNTGGFGHLNLDNVRIPIQTAVSSVTLNKSTTSLVVNKTETLIPTVNPTDADNKNLSWSSSNNAIASINSSGTVTAVAPGTATITVTSQDGSKTADCTVTVTAQPYHVLDFEPGNLTGWTVTSGTAFSNSGVCTDTNWGWGGPFTFQGTYHFWGYKTVGDAAVGEMKSANFTVDGNGQITFLIGGGYNINNLYIALCNSSGTELIRQTGVGEEGYSSRTMDASAYIGQSCYIKVVDNNAGGFGHINLDNIRIPATANGGTIMGLKSPDRLVLINAGVEQSSIVYPNPVADHFTVNLDDLRDTPVYVIITDLYGRLVSQTMVNGGAKYDYSARQMGLNRGIYILRLKASGSSKVVKMLVN